MHYWLNDTVKAAYEYCERDIRQRGYTDDEIRRMEHEKLSMSELKTTSVRIRKMIECAFLAGQLDGIKFCDDCFHEFSPSEVKKI